MAVRRRSRNWVFTLNNPGDEESEDPQSWNGYRYLVWQKERGEEGTPHLQGLVVWNNPQALSWCRNQNSRAHWEIMRGTLDQSIKYCTKEDTREDGPWTRGRKPQPGKSKLLIDACEMLDNGASMREVALSYPATYCQYQSGLKSYRMETSQDRSGEPHIIILWGPSGCGKSQLVHATFPRAYRKPKGKWWDGYHTQQTVVFDDFYSWISYDEILRILDWYPLLVEVKQSYVRLVANTFVFTSNQDPMDWYRGGRDGAPERDRKALWRRFKQFAMVMKYCDVCSNCRHESMKCRCKRFHELIKDFAVDTRFRDMSDL